LQERNILECDLRDNPFNPASGKPLCLGYFRARADPGKKFGGCQGQFQLGVWGRSKPPTGFGAEPRELTLFSASKPLRIHFRDQKYENFQENAYIIIEKHASFKKKILFRGASPPPGSASVSEDNDKTSNDFMAGSHSF